MYVMYMYIYVEERSLKENQPLQARGLVCETLAL